MSSRRKRPADPEELITRLAHVEAELLELREKYAREIAKRKKKRASKKTKKKTAKKKVAKKTAKKVAKKTAKKVAKKTTKKKVAKKTTKKKVAKKTTKKRVAKKTTKKRVAKAAKKRVAKAAKKRTQKTTRRPARRPTRVASKTEWQSLTDSQRREIRSLAAKKGWATRRVRSAARLEREAKRFQDAVRQMKPGERTPGYIPQDPQAILAVLQASIIQWGREQYGDVLPRFDEAESWASFAEAITDYLGRFIDLRNPRNYTNAMIVVERVLTMVDGMELGYHKKHQYEWYYMDGLKMCVEMAYQSALVYGSMEYEDLYEVLQNMQRRYRYPINEMYSALIIYPERGSRAHWVHS